ncbi:hypothetical protein BKA70DRAFT_1341794 [Coprinopsis sp. MPI-PUGE-AT-0042]|nr:hypothetical protein BKA70DRAFT_1341794 [Coprinopsis sp. MPI-PUGE-AT-0042]
MDDLHSHKPAHLHSTLKLSLRGQHLLSSSRFNKGTAFTPEERDAFGLNGRLPYRVNSLEEQCARAWDQLCNRDDPIRKNTFLQSLKEQNWVLYYGLLTRHLKDLVPIIYTPTEGDVIQAYSHLFRKPEGMYLTFENQDCMEEAFLEQTRGRELDLIVCTDAEAILGIGDQGVGGIGISTAKSAIYTLIGGLDPSRTLSVMLDVGTNNKDLLNDPIYVGWPHERIRGEGYDNFIDKFVQLVRKHYPNSLLHFEDFGVTNAYRLLGKYRDTHSVFNDDIQGTGAVTLACLMAAIGVSHHSSKESTSKPQGNRLSDQRIAIFGAGSAGLGITVQVRDAMLSADGVSRDDANRCFYLIDKDGLLFNSSDTSKASQGPEWNKDKDEFVRPSDEGWDDVAKDGKVSLLDVVRKVKPTVLIGCSTATGAFTEEIIRAMADGLTNGEKPIVFPLSNPTSRIEAKPEDILKWTNGRALVATGSPFPPVKMNVDGKEMEFSIGECNNALIYPGLGFGTILSRSRTMTDTMLLAGAQRLAQLSPAIKQVAPNSKDGKADEYNGESLLPDFADAHKVNFEVAVSVAERAVVEGSALVDWFEGRSAEELKDLSEEMQVKVKQMAQEKVWVPVYLDYVYDADGLTEV